MKQLVITLLSVIACIHSANSLAAGPSGDSKLGSISISNNGIVMTYRDSGVWNNPDNCTNSNFLVIAADASDRLVTNLLMAKAIDFTVNFQLRGCTAIGAKTFPNVVKVILR